MDLHTTSKKFHVFYILILFSALSAVQVMAAEKEIFTDQETNCVGWKTKKRLLIATVYPVGKSCDVQVRIHQVSNFFSKVIATVPIKSFNSGNSGRDSEVLKILAQDKQPFITFESKELSPQELTAFSSVGTSSLAGALRWHLHEHSVNFNVVTKAGAKDGQMILRGQMISTFTNFELKPPSVVGGIVAQVFDNLDLHFKIDSLRVEK